MKLKTRFLNSFRGILKVPFLERPLRTLTTGKAATSVVARMVPNNYQYPAGSIREFDYHGVKLSLDIHDYVSHYLYFGFRDPGHEKLMSLVRPGYTVLDIGTNYGTTILQFAKLVTESGKTYGFEPDPINFAICKANLALNEYSNLIVENIGLGREAAEVSLIVDTESNRGGNRVGVPSAGQESHLVAIWTLDEWVKQRNLEKIDLIKIDVEGYEMEVLAGAVETIKNFSPIFFVELDNSNLGQQGASAKGLVEFFESRQYLINHAESGAVVSSGDDFSGCHFDIVCVPAR